MPTCIYCKDEKDPSEFTKEHVLPRAFGHFRDNLTLIDSVCDNCNQAFGRGLDLHLARESPEGFLRFLLGTTTADRYKLPRSSSGFTCRVADGLFAGARVQNKCIDGELKQVPIPQVGFGKSPEGPFIWYSTNQLPTADCLRELIGTGDIYLQFLEISDTDAVVEQLRTKGGIADLTAGPTESLQADSRIEAGITVGLLFCRAISKIAFNYLAYALGSRYALLPQFDAIRDFIRIGKQPTWDVWRADPGPRNVEELDRVRHLIAVQVEGGFVLGYVRLCSYGRYLISLAEGGFLVAHKRISGHFFDLDPNERRTYPLPF